jgi:hypothetical protein
VGMGGGASVEEGDGGMGRVRETWGREISIKYIA